MNADTIATFAVAVASVTQLFKNAGMKVSLSPLVAMMLSLLLTVLYAFSQKQTALTDLVPHVMAWVAISTASMGTYSVGKTLAPLAKRENEDENIRRS